MTGRRKLLVEGSDDKHVLWGILSRENFPDCFTIEEKGGVDTLLKVFPVQVKGSRIEAVGILLDADTDLPRRWQQITSVIRELGYSPPELPPADGMVLEQEFMPRVGAWLMPNNAASGMLEDFVRYLVPDDDVLWSHATTVVANIPEDALLFSPPHVAKANIHTWLAWQSDPGTPMGLAITKKYLRSSTPETSTFLKWLERLFLGA